MFILFAILSGFNLFWGLNSSSSIIIPRDENGRLKKRNSSIDDLDSKVKNILVGELLENGHLRFTPKDKTQVKLVEMPNLP